MNSYLSYILPFLISLVLSLTLTPAVRFFAQKYNLAIPKPRPRDIHGKPIPRLGGVALFVSFWLVALGYLLFAPDNLYFINEKVLGIDKNLLGVFLGSLVLIIVGVIDDIRGMKPGLKLFWQFIAAILVVIFGIKIWWFSNPMGGANIVLANWTYIFVPIWTVLIINVINWLDGLDGLADGISLICLIVLGFLALAPNVNQPATALICAILAGVATGFLFFNFNPAKIFLGDSGSMFLGFMIAIASIISGGKVATAALVLGIPILDAIWVILRRIFSKKSPMQADKFHLHHRFLDIGLSQRQTVLILYTLSAGFGIVALQNGTHGKMIASLWLLLIMVIMGIALVFLKKTRNVKNQIPNDK